MTYLKNNKGLVFIIAVLLLSNIALLYFFVLKDGGNKQEKGFRQSMIESLKSEVGFSDDQIAQYEQLSSKHKESMKFLFDDIKSQKDSLYKLLVEPQLDDSVVAHHLQLIGEKQKNIDQRIFTHLRSLRDVCTAEQRPKYDSLVQRMTRKMINPQKNNDKKK